MQSKPNLPVQYSAKLYDQYTAQQIRNYDDLMAHSLLAAYREHGGDALTLDIGTGTGQLLIYLAQAPEFDRMRFEGLDLFDDMVAQARQNVHDHALDARIRIVQGDVHRLPQPDDYADFIVSRSTIHHWAEPVQAFREMVRVLKPFGIMIIHDLRRDPPPDILAESNRRRAEIGVPPTNLAEKYTVAEIWDLLEQADIADLCAVGTTEDGIAAIGFEIRMRKVTEWA